MVSLIGTRAADRRPWRARFGRIVACFAALMLAGVAAAQTKSVAAPSIVAFTPAEMQSILSHGPWPVPWTKDPSNRASGNAEAIELGERLFFDQRLSGDGRVACATCHAPERRWTDGKARGFGRQQVDRNTPHLSNVRLNRWFGWGGATDSLWAQSVQPILDARELGADPKHVADLLRADPDLACRYEKVFGRAPAAADAETVLVDVAKVLAAFQETLGTWRTPFDEFRDALARGDAAGAAKYPQAAQRGLQIFIGKGACNLCHVGPNFTNGEFHAIGVSFFAAPGRVDAGRYEGIKQLQSSPFNLLGRYNDDPLRTSATSAKHVRLEQRNYGEFRTPSLRNAGYTAPYMHDGQIESLRDVVRHYSTLKLERLHGDGESLLKPIKLTEAETSDLVVFLESLTNYSENWWRTPPEHVRPRCR